MPRSCRRRAALLPPPLVYINRAGRRHLVDDVPFVQRSRAHVARLRRAMDGSAHQVCAPVLRVATFGGAQVRSAQA